MTRNLMILLRPSSVALVVLLGGALVGRAALAAPQLDQAAIEREAEVIDAMLIAPCCFSQQVSVHKSPAAAEAKADIRARLAAGQSRAQILDAYVAKYGKHVLAEPPAEGFDRTLYVLPFVVLFAGVGVVALVVRRATGRPRAGANTPAETVTESLESQLDDELRDLD